MVNCVIACFLHRSVYVCVCGFVWVAYVFAPVCVCVHVCMCVSLRDGDCMHTSLHLDNCVRVCVWVCVGCLCVRSGVCVCACLCVCVLACKMVATCILLCTATIVCVYVCVCMGLCVFAVPWGCPDRPLANPPDPCVSFFWAKT